MIKNYIKTAWRNIQKRKFHAIINIVGLVSSMAFVLLIAAYVWQTYQINSGLRHQDRQYILQSEYKKTGIGLELTTVGALPKALREEYPHLVANYYRIDGLTCIISNGTAVHEESVSLGDSTLLDMFGFELFEGNPSKALTSPFSVVITESAAIKYFGKKEVLGQNLTIRNFAGEKHDFVVTGVLKPTSQNSVTELNAALSSSIFLPIASEAYFGRNVDNWNTLWIAGFIELQENVQPEQLAIPIQNLLRQHANEEVATNLIPQLKPLSSYYLNDNKGAIRQLTHVLVLIAGFLLVMAVVNFINFTVSQSFTRLKEIGVRKMMGSNRLQLILQLTTEYLMLVWIAGLGALALYPVLAPLFESIMLTALPDIFELPVSFFVYFMLTVFFLGMLSGLYPAMKLSQNRLLESLKNQLTNIQQKHLIRRILLFTQFTVTIVVLIAAVVVSRQVDIFTKGDLGYDKDYLITVQAPRDWSEAGLHKIELVREQLRALPYVKNISLSYGVPGSFADGIQQVQKVGSEDEVDALMITSDRYFSDTYNIPLLAGQFFSSREEATVDNSKLVINNKAAKALGYHTPEEAIGQQVSLFNNRFTGTIAGVTDDFYANSMHSASPPVIWFSINNNNQYRFLSIRLKAGSTFDALTALEKNWKQLMPDAPFEFRFMDDTIKNMYTVELQLQRASQIATVISIVIVALGLIGLTALAINLRLKEVGIRKVLGASFRQIIMLFSKEFYMTFFLAVLLGCPLVYTLMDKWLANYTSRTELHLGVFVLPLLGLVLLLFFITGGIILSVVKANPVDSLRNE
ncbi:ABC transporter permease [Sphingobacterium corticibacterium]|uniref:ABC transporter permease n=1 Tax=Sphingobacterium corticibacterium TaxID=2484746 RepID=A0A4Q6XGE8_9SPHI|nr:ABC transporter permease [Sphingobacterium corticibacterium]RZF58095.1 ABC transporter permease [Sphingobacterium corticibacterium]